MSTNIVTVRNYEDKTIGLSINGREIPDCRVAMRDKATGDVYIRIGCGVYNDLKGDELEAAREMAERIAALPITLHGKQSGVPLLVDEPEPRVVPDWKVLGALCIGVAIVLTVASWFF